MTTCIIAEKPSVARDIARIVGATHPQDGFIEGKGYLVTWAFGHLITLALPEYYGDTRPTNSPSSRSPFSSSFDKSARGKPSKTTQQLSNS